MAIGRRPKRHNPKAERLTFMAELERCPLCSESLNSEGCAAHSAKNVQTLGGGTLEDQPALQHLRAGCSGLHRHPMGAGTQAVHRDAGSVIKSARLMWRLLWDPGVSTWLKMIPPASLLYLLFPFDFLPDLALGLGQLDDIAIILLGLKLFIELSPQEVVRHHLREMSSVPGSYRVVDEEPSQGPLPSSYIEAPYRVIEEDEKE